MRYEIKNKVCRQKKHDKIYLIDHDNVWWCKKCKTICCGNGKRMLPCNYEYYKNWMIKLELKYYTEDEIKRWVENSNRQR